MNNKGFSGGPVARTQHFQCRGRSSNPGQTARSHTTGAAKQANKYLFKNENYSMTWPSHFGV